MPVVLTYVILLLGALGSLIHSLLTDPSSDAILSPKVKAALGLVGLLVAALLPALQNQFGQKPPTAPPSSTNRPSDGEDKEPPATLLSVLALRAAVAYVVIVLSIGVGTLLVSCATLPLPKGESVTQTDGGVQVCVQWAKNPMTDAGPDARDAK